MYLKRLDMVGFKSFAKRTSIDFVPGLTAVVGPNGSGKSNVTDAIRWVLGEQSAKSLRGAKMEDIIFSGSDAHRAVNVAEVTLVLDNSDERVKLPYNEVSVTRRVHRSGESEYLLNNQACRLKDITDLFMDSGLGKEAFSIISQGRVDEILNSRPQDRRAIFEEAAGVLKYKLRKKKAEHKLFEADENLLRVLDILHELSDRLAPLEQQASKARDYLQMTADVRDYDIAVMVADATAQLTAMQAHQATEQQYKEQEQKFAKQVTELEALVQNLISERQTLDQQYENTNASLLEASTEVERLTGYQAVSAEKAQNKAQRLAQLEAAKAQQVAQISALTEKQQQERTHFATLQTQVKEQEQQVKQYEHVLQRSAKEIDKEIEQQRNRYIDLMNEQVTVKNDMKHIEQQMARQQAMTSRVSTQNDEASEQLHALQQQFSELTKRNATLHDKLGHLRQQLKQQTQQVDKQKNAFEKKQAMLYEAYQHQHRLKARKDTLEELAADFSGFYQGVRAVLQARASNQLQGIDGAVAELVHVPKQYTQAIETALGASSQHIITTDEKAAQYAIQYLKRKKEGRATFLPRTVIKPRLIQSHILQEVASHPAFINTASALVSANQQYEAIVANLLGSVIVAQDLQGATAIARLAGFRYRVVTLEGDVVNAGGSLTGGAAQRQSNVFSRKLELDDLASKLTQINAQITTAEADVQQGKLALQAQQQQLIQLREDVESTQQQAHASAAQVTALENDKKHLEARVSVVATERTDATEQIAQLTAQYEQATARVTALTQELTQIDEQVQSLTNLKEKSELERDTLRAQLDDLRPKLAVSKEKRAQTSEAIASYELAIEQAKAELASITEDIAWFTKEQDEQDSPEALTQKIIAWQTTKQESEKCLLALREARATNRVTLQDKEVMLQKLRMRHQGYVEQLHDIALKIERAHSRITYIEEQLWEQYEWDLRSQQDVPELTIDIEQARRRVKLLKQSIEELGTVNVDAIAEYEQVMERYTFLQEQRNDLVEAQQTLNEAICEMDSEMTVRFKTTFEEIRTHFHSAFRELFGGGNADLVLIDPTNLLETGIEIVAQPPGKKLQSLSLLSGGERALVAIALLFAILKTRPVPFCVLDEVEAALDEANVTRYAEYLRKLSGDTQFIVITHRKGTMEGADVLYGITMQESGVSKLVSVKLEQYEEERQ